MKRIRVRPAIKSASTFLNTALAPLGIKLVQANKPPRSLADFFSHVKRLGFHPALIVDVGVADGTPDIYNAYPKSKYILIKPLVEFETVLKQLCRQLEEEYILAGAGELEFNVHDDLHGSSLLGEVEGSLANGVPRKVPTVCLDDVLADRTESPILLKIDVQGAELRALRGAQKSLNRIDMIAMEVALVSSMEDGPDFFDVIDFMQQIDFYLYDIAGGKFRPLDGSLKQVDLVFVQKENSWRADRRYATVEQRQRLNELGRKRWGD